MVQKHFDGFQMLHHTNDVTLAMVASKRDTSKGVGSVNTIQSANNSIPIQQVIDSLRFGGFKGHLSIFAEPGTALAKKPNVTQYYNERVLGTSTNWKHALRTMVDISTTPNILLIEDDIAFCRGAFQALSQQLAVVGDYGFLTLCLFDRKVYEIPEEIGWFPFKPGAMGWGTQAICYNRNTIIDLLGFKKLKPIEGNRGGYDQRMYEFYASHKLPSFAHNPSLVEHLGNKVSTFPAKGLVDWTADKNQTKYELWCKQRSSFRFNSDFQP